MTLAGHLLSFLGGSATHAPAESFHPIPATGRGWAECAIANRLREAIHVHTRRQIALALGGRIVELNRAIRENPAAETRTEDN